VRPLVCLTSNGEGSITAEFSYVNSAVSAVLIEPNTDRNRLVPPSDIVLPREFLPVGTRFAFSVPIGESQVTWFLDGNTAVASRQTPLCVQPS
jgi:hypothetical protein